MGDITAKVIDTVEFLIMRNLRLTQEYLDRVDALIDDYGMDEETKSLRDLALAMRLKTQLDGFAYDNNREIK